MNFCPTPGYYNKKEIKTDIKNFERKIELKSFFELKNLNKLNKHNNVSSNIPNIKPKSTWEPPKNHHTINRFIEALNNDVDELFQQKQTLPRNNISQHERNVINKFSKPEDLVFTKADKGGAIVILEVGDYIEKADKELKDENYYKKLSHNPTHEHMKIVNDAIDTFHRQQV